MYLYIGVSFNTINGQGLLLCILYGWNRTSMVKYIQIYSWHNFDAVSPQTKSKLNAISKFSIKMLTKGIFNPKIFDDGQYIKKYTQFFLLKKHHQNQEKPETTIN